MPARPLTKPHDVFARDQEWSDLVDFATSPDPGLRLAIVRGRRRQGKSFLLRRLARACNGFYYQALEEERTQALESFGAAQVGHRRWRSSTSSRICWLTLPSCSQSSSSPSTSAARVQARPHACSSASPHWPPCRACSPAAR